MPALILGLSLLLSSCGGSKYTYVGSQADQVFLKVPSHWKSYTENVILQAIGLDGTPSASSFKWLTAFDSAPDPKLGNVLEGVPKHPVVITYVRELSPQARDQFSLAQIRNSWYQVDQAVNNDQGDIIDHKDITLEGGLYGAQDIYDITGGVGDISAANGAIMVNQIGILDPGNHKLYLLVIQCEAKCYEHNRTTINEVAQSYSVKES